MATSIKDSPLGSGSEYVSDYAPQLLYPVPRSETRAVLGLGDALPFTGEDLWNAYEVSWLGPHGLPVVRMGTLTFDATSPNIIESKSLKLYLNSLNNTRFESEEQAIEAIRRDLAAASGAPVRVRLAPPSTCVGQAASAFEGWCIDDDSTQIDTYEVSPRLLHGAARGPDLCATVYSDLLRSCCPVTGQPDWASVMIRYEGPWIDHRALLRYLVSFRNHAEFHEHCVERIFVDLKTHCGARKLSVYARYTRRGGLDINPFRSDFEKPPHNWRHERQ